MWPWLKGSLPTRETPLLKSHPKPPSDQKLKASGSVLPPNLTGKCQNQEAEEMEGLLCLNARAAHGGIKGPDNAGVNPAQASTRDHQP